MISIGIILCGVLSLTAHAQMNAGIGPSGWRMVFQHAAEASAQTDAGNEPSGRREENQQNQPGAGLGEPTLIPAGAPHNWQDLVSMGDGVRDVMDFINLLTTADGRPVAENDIFSPYQTAEGKRVINGGGLMATSDECSPRNMSVRIPLDYSDNQIAYYPECTMVQRCGGCCPTPYLTCEPRYKEKIVLKVLRARYLYPGALSMQWEGYTSVEVERHLSCESVCRMEPGDCGTGKRFIPHQCKCQCLYIRQCPSTSQQWDDQTCQCRCRNQRPCCEDHQDERTCVSFFNHDLCDCTLKTSIGASVNATQAEIDAWLANRNRYNPLPTPSQTADDTTPTTTTPTPTTPADPCADLTCPPNFRRLMSPRGCVCRFSMMRPRARG